MSGIGTNEMEEVLKGQDEKFDGLEKRFDKLEELIKSLMGTGIRVSGPGGNQSSSSQQSQQPVSSPESSEKSEEEKKEEKWEAFFDGKGITSPEQKTAWKVTSGLVPDEAQTVWSNGWEDLTEKGGISKLGSKKVSYTSKGEIADGVELLNHRKGALNLIHEYIVDIRNAENLSLFNDEKFSDEKIKEVIGETKVPASRNYVAIKKIRDDRVRKLFKENFGLVGQKSISDGNVDAWRKAGLGGDGTNERKAYNNGWTKPEEIKDGKVVNYTTPDTNQTTTNINVLVVNKNELDKAHKLLFGIKATKNFRELDKWKEDNKEAIGKLKDNQLPEDNLTAMKARKLWDNNWDASDIQEKNGDIEVVNPKTGEKVVGYKNIIALGVVKDKSAPAAIDPVAAKSEISEENIAWRKAMGGAATGSRNQKLDGTGKTEADNVIMDKWFALTETGGGKIASGKQQKNIWDVAQEHRKTFTYYLDVEYNEVEGDGLVKKSLTDAQEKLKEKNRWKPEKEYKPLTAAILNELLEDFFDENIEKENLNEEWLAKLGGYIVDKEPARKIKVAEVKKINDREELTGERIDMKALEDMTISGAEVAKKEKDWSDQERLDLTGTYLLAFVHDLINFDLDNYRPNNDGTYNKEFFARLDDKGQIDMTGPGVAPILTGGGKTTKDVGCLVDGGNSNIILICPNEALASDAYNHHKTWLQKDSKTDKPYKCVIHGVHHGFYETVKNDLIYWEDKSQAKYNKGTKTWENVKKMGQKGLSILQAEKLLGYMACSSVKTEDLKEPTPAKKAEIEKKHKEKPNEFGGLNENFAENIAEIKKKLISKEETIIIFDEAHFADAKYQELQKQLIKNNYQVIIMSATFPKKDFSITTSHPRDVWLVNQFEPEYSKTRKDENGKEVKIEKWEQQKTQIFLRTTEDEWELHPRTGEKIKQTLWSGLTEKQKKLLDDNDISYVCFDRTNQEAVTGITKGMPLGTLFFANPDHEMGFSPFVHNVILTGQTQLISLGKGKETPWIYDTPETIPLPMASMVQQIGRVARLFSGTAYLLTKELRDVDASTGKLKKINPPKDLSYKFVSAIMANPPNLQPLLDAGVNFGKADEPNFLRAAVALPYKFGYKPEEIAVGLSGVKAKPAYPTYGNKPPVVDEELWNRHLGNPTPPKIDKERSKQILLIIATTFLKNEPDITKGIDVSFDNSLIKEIWGKEVTKKGKKTEMVLGEDEAKKVVEEVRKVLHTVADEYRKGLKGYEDGKNGYSAEEKDTFQALVRLYRAVNEAEIKVETVLDKGKEKINVEITYPIKEKQKEQEGQKEEKLMEDRSMNTIIEIEEIGVWRCYWCLKVNNGYRFCEQCGINVRLSEKAKDEEKLIEELQANIEINKDNEFHWRW